MNNFELIDDYLANRLQETDRKAFEQQLEGDPDLKDALEFQQQVVSGVRQARAVELKAMLNNVPIGTGSWGGTKIAAGIISAGIVATSLYFYLNEDPEIINAFHCQMPYRSARFVRCIDGIFVCSRHFQNKQMGRLQKEDRVFS